MRKNKPDDLNKEAPNMSMVDLYWLLTLQSDTLAATTQGFTPIAVPELGDLKVPKSFSSGSERKHFSPEVSSPNNQAHSDFSAPDYSQGPVDETTWNNFLDHLEHREGYRNVVYRDSLGKPTVGVGHLVRSGDNLQVGDRISDEQVRGFLEKDAGNAYKSAVEQANELGINDSQFVVALGSVNYQLGTGWRKKFPKTWEAMKDGDFDKASANLERSLWNKQTPVRVDDFQKALARADKLDEQPTRTASVASGEIKTDVALNKDFTAAHDNATIETPTGPIPDNTPKFETASLG